jgi:hypothetical protein
VLYDDAGGLVTSKSKAKGSAWERAIVNHLIASGWPFAERRIAGAVKDRGDIAGVAGVVIEARTRHARRSPNGSTRPTWSVRTMVRGSEWSGTSAAVGRPLLTGT